MAIVQTTCTAYKKALLEAEIDFSVDTAQVFKMALYTSDASLDASTPAYTTTNEVSGTGYTAGGATLTVVPPVVSGSVAYVDFANPVWVGASFTARGALIYKEGGANTAIIVLKFGEDKTVSGGNFQVTLPPANATDAIIRVV
jgi:hypothetical protein